MRIKKKFTSADNLEFVLSNKSQNISKVLYRSFWDYKAFRKDILIFFRESWLLTPLELEKLEKIFKLDFIQGRMFHFGEDNSTQRYKFYIWLYYVSLKDALKIISDIKNILGIKDKYFLEKEFIRFDCLGFDIKDGKVSLKVYELLKKDDFISNIPTYLEQDNIKEIWILKDFKGRKKLFYRFETPLSLAVFESDFRVWDLDELKNTLSGVYFLQKKVKYYCEEWNTKEIYFM